MTSQAYEQLILEGLQGLPPEALTEIADFVYFVRRRILQPEAFREELDGISIRAELRELGRQEEAHLEEEFEGYDRKYPRE
jgi:hypothetical protein